MSEWGNLEDDGSGGGHHRSRSRERGRRAIRNVRWSIDEEGAMVQVRPRGRFALRQIERFRAELLADPAFRANLVCIVDLRSAGALPETDIEHAAADFDLHADTLAFRRLALIAPEPPHDQLVHRYARLVSNCGIPVRVFSDALEALQWCDARDREVSAFDTPRAPADAGDSWEPWMEPLPNVARSWDGSMQLFDDSA